MRDCPGTGWVPKICLCVFFGPFLMGEKKHINKTPPKSRDSPGEILLRVLFFMCFFRSLLSSGKEKTNKHNILGGTVSGTNGARHWDKPGPVPGTNRPLLLNSAVFRNGPNTVSESTVSNSELSEFFGPHRVPGSELSEFLSAYYLCVSPNSPSFFAELTEFAAKLSEFSLPKQYSRNSIPPVSQVKSPFCPVCP